MAPNPPNARGPPAEPWGPSTPANDMGAPRWPLPKARGSPAEPWRPSTPANDVGAPRWPPNPPRLGAPRRSRGAPRHPLVTWGPRDGPRTPQGSGPPGGAVAPLDTR